MIGNPIWNSFAAGELSPRFWSRSDTRLWRNGAARLRNVLCYSHGPAARRGGFRFQDAHTCTDARVFSLYYTFAEAFTFLITDTDDLLVFNVSNGQDAVLEQTLVSPFGADQLASMHYGTPPGGLEVYFVAPKVHPQQLKRDPTLAVGSEWTIAPIAFTAPPADWAVDNYPDALTFFEGRLYFASTFTKPEAFWGSKSGDLFNFTFGSADDDAFEFELSEQGKIEWMIGAQNLLIGTTNGEHLVESDQGVITPSDVHVTQQSAYGSRNAQVARLGNVVLYVSPDGRKVRDVGYEWEENTWLSRDITFLSEHITKGNTIKSLVWAQNPDNLLFCVTDQGNFLACTYERYQDIVGWHGHNSDGDFLDFTSVDINGNSEVYAAVDRDGSEVHLEKYVADDFMDNYFELASPTVDITLPHLADKTVQILIDGATHPDILLDSGGNGTMERTGTRVLVGLYYLPEWISLPLDYTPEEQGTSQHYMKRWNKIFTRLFESPLPLINGERPPERHPSTPMDTAEPVPSIRDVRVANLGRDRVAQIVISQDLPYGFTIAGVFGEIGQNRIGG